MSHWRHPHSVTTGVIAGLALAHNSLLLAALAFLLGAATVAGWRYIARAGRWTKHVIEGFAWRT